MTQPQTIPVVDLSLSDTEAAQLIRQACSTVGFFYVTNHGIASECIANAFEQIQQFYALPLDEKMKIYHDDNDRGYSPPYNERFDPTATKGDSKERLSIGLETLTGTLALRGANKWPDANLLPSFKPAIESYFTQILTFAKERMARLLSLSLNLDMTALATYLQNPTVVMTPLHYFQDVSYPEQGIYACGAHSDYGILTVLATDEVSGLQVKIGQTWIDVPYMADTFVVNIGDMTMRLTNGFYKSAVHRVVTTHGQERYSIPLFLDPSVDAKIEPLPQFCPDGVAKFDACIYGDYLFNKYATTNATYTGPTKMN